MVGMLPVAIMTDTAVELDIAEYRWSSYHLAIIQVQLTIGFHI